MTTVPPFHSSRPQYHKVYHDDDDCRQGQRIRPENRVAGTGNWPRCGNCIRLEKLRASEHRTESR
jgi:hypothetical protein